MELKKYQKEVLHDLDDFFETLKRHIRLDIAYEKFWEERGISLRANDDCLRPYDNIISGVPRVTLKIPTAGGKTFVACNALRHIFDHYATTGPQVVVWFVPSDTLLTQTFLNLNNPLHPYRQQINALFSAPDRKKLLMTHIIPNQFSLLIFSPECLSRAYSFRVRNRS